MSLETLIESVHAKVPQMHELTRGWVEINSYSKNVAGVNACGAALDSAFQIPGLSLRTETGGGASGDHLFWSTPAAASQRPILLVGHHDTVFPPGHFEGYRASDGRGYGPGCLDMKGGIALIWGVLSTLSDAGLLAAMPIVVVSVADEEVGSLDSAPHLERLGRSAACALVFESGRPKDSIVTRRRGVGTLRVVASGRAAHSGNAHADGANAIWALSRFIDAAQALTNYDRGVTVSVGMVKGGTSTNTVPAHAEASVDVRFESIVDAHALLAALREAASRCAVPGTQLEVEGDIKRLPMEKTAASELLYREYAACQREARLGYAEQPLVGGGSDANTLSAVGLPCIDGLGPRGGGFHTLDEFIELESFRPKAEALLRFLHGRQGALVAR
ncbi:MAG: M20 family metallopeptidase [Polyangiaceae bacterium]